MALVSWLWIALLACAVAVLIAAEWPRLAGQLGRERREARARARQKANLTLVTTETDADDFAASVQRDLSQLPTTKERDRKH